MSPSFASGYTVSVEGVSPWLGRIAERSLTAVADKLQEGQSEETTKHILRVVSDRLFTGYRTSGVSLYGSVLKVALVPLGEPPLWRVELQQPQLQAPASGWFASDMARIEGAVMETVRGLPVEALSWADTGLRDEIEAAASEALPGWQPSLVVVSQGDAMLLRVSFTPQFPLVLAVSPRLSSSSLPTLLHGELKEDLMERASPFIGLPVVWAAIHTKDINKWTEDFLEDKNIVQRTASDLRANFSAGQVSHVNVEVESRHYTLGAWAAVYAGTNDRAAELGVHIGRRVRFMPGKTAELYGEGIIQLQEWSPEARLGFRLSPWGDVWLGGEWSTKDDMWWGRFTIDPRLHKPYAWFRIREDGEVNAALGWKATEYISFELHYDSRDNDTWSLRMLGNL